MILKFHELSGGYEILNNIAVQLLLNLVEYFRRKSSRFTKILKHSCEAILNPQTLNPTGSRDICCCMLMLPDKTLNFQRI